MSKPSYKKVKEMSTEDLIKKYNNLHKSSAETPSFYLDEISRRKQEQYSCWMLVMTVIIVIATIVNIFI